MGTILSEGDILTECPPLGAQGDILTECPLLAPRQNIPLWEWGISLLFPANYNGKIAPR